jgi:hypothetical protein
MLFDNYISSNKVFFGRTVPYEVLAHNPRLRKKLGIDLVGKLHITERESDLLVKLQRVYDG